MVRFSGQALPEGCRIALITNDAIGNYVVVTPLIKMLKEQFKPGTLHYYGGIRTKELWATDPLIDRGFAFHGGSPWESVSEWWQGSQPKPYDLIVNVENHPWAKAFASLISQDRGFLCGPALRDDARADLPFAEDERGHLWEDKRWIAGDIVSKYPFLDSGFIGEIFARLCYLSGPLPAYRIQRDEPPFAMPDVLIATTASLQEKLWPFEKWRAALEWLRAKGVSVGLLGAPPKAQQQYWTGSDAESQLVAAGLAEDLRGKLTLTEVAGALERAKAVLSLDNGILHLAASTDTPVVDLFRHGIHRLWAPPFGKLTIVTPGEARAVAELKVEHVTEALERVL